MTTFTTSTRLAAMLAAGVVLFTATGGAHAGVGRIPTGPNTLGGHPAKIQTPPASIPKGPNAGNQANAPTQPAPTKPTGGCTPPVVTLPIGQLPPCT